MGKANLAEYANDGHFSPERLRPGVERVRPVQVADRLLRRHGHGGRVVASPPRASARRPATPCGARRARSRSCRCAAPTACSRSGGTMPLTYIQDYVGLDQPVAPGPRAAAQRDHDRQPGRHPRRRLQRPPARGLDRRPGRQRAPGQGHRRAADRVRRSVRHAGHRGRDARVRSSTSWPPARPSRRSRTRRPARRARPATAATRAGASGCSSTRTRRTRDAAQILRSPLRLPQFRNTNPYTGTGAMTLDAGRARSRPSARSTACGSPPGWTPTASTPSSSRASSRTSTSTTRSSRASAAATRRPRPRACRT